MKQSLKLILLASTIVGLATAGTTAAFAQYHRWDDRNRGVSPAHETGGYCDSAGCPDRFWKYPIHYGPVFVHGHWYRGPVYFRGGRYNRQYWVSGGWHRDEWRGHRPWWARQSHDGPPLAFEYYADHGFQLGDHWRHEYEADSRGDNSWDGRDRRDNGGNNSGDWQGRDNSDRRNQGDNSRNWQGADNAGAQGNGYHGGDNGNRDLQVGRGGNSTGDQGRWWDHNGRDNSGNSNDQHAGSGNNGPSPAPSGNMIHVTAATYGAICHQPSGNVTKYLADACNGRATCDYVVQYQTIGDPSPGCAKDFSVQWSCSAGPGGNVNVPAEAGLGTKVALQCANTGH